MRNLTDEQRRMENYAQNVPAPGLRELQEREGLTDEQIQRLNEVYGTIRGRKPETADEWIPILKVMRTYWNEMLGDEFEFEQCDHCHEFFPTYLILPLPPPEKTPNWTSRRRMLCPGCYAVAQRRLLAFAEKLSLPDDEFEQWLEEW